MKKTLLEIYALAVCFVTITCFAITLGIAIYDVIQFSAPEFCMSSYDFEKHQSNEIYTRNWDKEKRERYTAEEITTLRNESYRVEILNEKRSAIQSFIMSCIVILIDVVVFFIHWKVAQKARNSNDPSNNLHIGSPTQKRIEVKANFSCDAFVKDWARA